MMRAVMEARLGDAARGDDPTVSALEAAACDITGKAQALFVPSGTMANLAAIIAHGCRDAALALEETSHVYNAEGGGFSTLAGAIARPLRGARGILDPDHVGAALRAEPRGRIRLLCIENTHNAAGGTVTPLATLRALHRVAQRADVALHLDGARLFNAAVYLGVPVADLCAHAESVMFSLCKGLGGPIGAILAGDAAFMARARGAVRMLGGGMRQAGLVAAPALVALRDPYPAHARDHALAGRLARGLAATDATLLDPAGVETNIVNCDVHRHAADASDMVAALRARGVHVNSRGSIVRFVTHAQVDDAAVDTAIAVVREVLGLRPAASR
jgi:threonine aldolase